jgi:hypothetical protein
MRKDRRKFLYNTTRMAAGIMLFPDSFRVSSKMETRFAPLRAVGTTYYVDTAGSNQNSGTSISEPWENFKNINAKTFTPGDSILLKRGCVWHEELKINGVGSPEQFITLATYGVGDRPKIQRDGNPSDRCMRLNNSSCIKVSSIEVSNGGAGIVLFYDHSYNNRSVYFDDIVAHDFMGLPHGGQSDRVSWSYGIGVTGVEDKPNNQTRVLSDLRITNTEVYNTGAGIALDWGNHFCADGSLALNNKFGDVYMEHLNLYDNTVDPVSFASLFLTSVTGCTIRNSTIDKGCKYAATGTSALQIMYSKNVTLQNVKIKNTPFNPCPDNSAVDFEVRNENVLVDGCSFENNAGPAIEILATPNNADPYTRNFVIRNSTFLGNNWARKLGNYQISVPDWQHGNFPTGKISDNKYSNAPNTHFFGGDGNTAQIKLSGNINIGQPESEATVVKSWKFDTGGNLKGWRIGNGISKLQVSSGHLEGTINGVDPSILSPEGIGIPISAKTSVRIVMKNATKGTFGQIYFITDADLIWNEGKHRDFWLYPEEAGYKTYDLDMSLVAGWTGTLEMFRVDPEQGVSKGTFSIDRIEILRG